MGRSFDYTDFQNHRNNFANMAMKFDAWLRAFMLQEGLRFIRDVKVRTPVDTGDLRNHWQLSKIYRTGDAIAVEFVNPMRYATFVEYGHAKPYKSGATEGSADWVEGYFMMTVALEDIYRAMPTRFDAEFSKFLASLKVI